MPFGSGVDLEVWFYDMGVVVVFAAPGITGKRGIFLDKRLLIFTVKS